VVLSPKCHLHRLRAPLIVEGSIRTEPAFASPPPLPAAEAVEVVRSLPHGHVLATLGTARRIALDAVLPRRAPQRRRDLALALIVARLLEPAAKLATARMLDPATASHSLGEV
jgi:hypothetical protein